MDKNKTYVACTGRKGFMEIVKEYDVEVGRDIWFPASNINFLCKKNNGSIVCKEMLPDYDIR